jgi:translation initiation factor IF-1
LFVGGYRLRANKRWDTNCNPKSIYDMADSEKAIELEGTIRTVLPGTMFRVALANEHLVLAHISGKMRKRFIRLTIGDRVKMEMSPYDTARARIVYRL